MLPALKGAIAAAFATGAYALVIPSIWLLADSVGWARLLLLMVAAIVAMVAWIIVAHNLWERPSDREQRKWAALYNGVTVLTVTSAVLAAYAILFALIFWRRGCSCREATSTAPSSTPLVSGST